MQVAALEKQSLGLRGIVSRGGADDLLPPRTAWVSIISALCKPESDWKDRRGSPERPQNIQLAPPLLTTIALSLPFSAAKHSGMCGSRDVWGAGPLGP